MPATTTLSAEALAAGHRLFSLPWGFSLGVAELSGLPEARRPEVAFAGRSNVGKSSLLNALLARRGELARTSNTPGRTQELNYFSPEDSSLYLVDMPGYGFAKAPKEKVAAWTELVRDYLKGRPTLRRVFLLIDSRHGLKPPDRETMRMLDTAAVPYQVVLTKSDKVSDAALVKIVAATVTALADHPAAFPEVMATSSAKGLGLEELRAAVASAVEG